MESSNEIYRLAYPDHEKDSSGNTLYAHVSYGLPFPEACAKHVSDTYHAKKAYIIASTSLSKQTSHVRDLEKALRSDHVATWIGIRPHTPWEDLVPIINDMREKGADCLITLGGGSLIDGAKIIIYVSGSDPKFQRLSAGHVHDAPNLLPQHMIHLEPGTETKTRLSQTMFGHWMIWMPS